MATMTQAGRGMFLPKTSHTAGTPLWGAAPRRQPIVPLIAMALLTLLIAAPAAMSGTGQSSNPVVLMRKIADSVYEITGLMSTSNKLLAKIDRNTQPLRELNANMAGIGASTHGMAVKTTKLSEKLANVGGSVRASSGQLVTVDRKLAATSGTMGQLRTSVDGSLGSTRTIVGEFSKIDRSIGAMDSGLKKTITLMAGSTPQTRIFAENKTRMSIAGGDGRKFGIPNISPGSRVMSVILPMITTMQTGGNVIVRKDSAKASNPLVGFLLKRQLPDGTNAILHAQPYDGFYGMPSQEWFITHQVDGF